MISETQREFIKKFRRLKEWIDGDADNLVRYAQQDVSIRDLLLDVFRLHSECNDQLTNEGTGILTEGDGEFVKSARDFRDNYLKQIPRIHYQDMLKHTLAIKSFPPEVQAKFTEIEKKFYEMEPQFDEWSKALATSNPTSIYLLMRREGELIMEDLKNAAQEGSLGEQALLDFFTRRNFDIGEARARESITPHFYIPKELSDRHHDDSKFVFFTMIEQAMNAFIFGSGLGAIALLRSIMETLLKEHYGSNGRDLDELISNARGLPLEISRADLHQLRRFANEVLHGATIRLAERELKDTLRFDQNFIRFVEVIRELIESATK